MCSGDSTAGTSYLDGPPYDPDTYWGRVRNIFVKNNPLHLFSCPETIEEARCLYLKYRCGEPIPNDVTDEELYRAKVLYDSAYHQETGQPIAWLARTPVQVPINAILAGGMMAYYKSTPGVIVWQWLNQTYNAFVNFAHRANDEDITDNQIMTGYALATGTAVATALTLKHLLRNSPPLIGRFVPFAAVAAAHCVSVPVMKAQLLRNGTPIYDECEVRLGYSKRAAQAGIGDNIMSKMLLAFPPMFFTPLVMNYLEGRGTLCRYPWINFPAHVGIAGLCLLFLSPLAAALFRNKSLMSFNHLEPELKDALCKKFHNNPPRYVYYNKSI